MEMYVDYDEKDIFSKLEYHIKEILKLLNVDINKPDIRETPKRFARVLLELTRGLREEAPTIKFFTMDGAKLGSDVYITIRDIRFVSLCEHHLLPVIGNVSVVYVPRGNEVPGLSKVARIVKWFCAKPILQERVTIELAEYLLRSIKAKFIHVKMCALHTCTYIRGVKDENIYMVTEAWTCLEEYREKLNEFLKHSKKLAKCSLKIRNT